LKKWSQAIKSQSPINRVLNEMGAEPTDHEDFVDKIEHSKKSASLEIMSFAFDKIRKEEHRTSHKLTQAEKNRIVMQFLKLNQGIKKRSQINHQT